MRGLVDKIKKMVIYDADRDFYAKIFPDSVSKKDLLHIRQMTHADLADVMRIERQNYTFPWEEDIFTDCFKAGYYCAVCEDIHGRLVAYCLMSIAVGEAHVLNISVDPAEQKQGIGRRIMEHLITYANSRAQTLFLEVRPSNTTALALYQSLGFNEIGIRKAYYPAPNGREDAIMLALHLF